MTAHGRHRIAARIGVIRRVEARIAELGGEGALAAAKANDVDLNLDPAAITAEAMGLDDRGRGG